MTTLKHKWHICEAMLKEGISCKVTVSGHSMRPLLRSGDTVEIRPYGKSRPDTGDVVLAREQITGSFLMHRIIGCRNGRYTLKGDNCENADKIFTKEEILGKVAIIDGSSTLLNTWPARKALALSSRSGRRMIKAGLALRELMR